MEEFEGPLERYEEFLNVSIENRQFSFFGFALDSELGVNLALVMLTVCTTAATNLFSLLAESPDDDNAKAETL